MIIFTQTKTTKCYGVTVLRRYGKCNCVTASQCHCVMQEGKCNCATA